MLDPNAISADVESIEEEVEEDCSYDNDDFPEHVEWQDLPWGGDDDFASWEYEPEDW